MLNKNSYFNVQTLLLKLKTKFESLELVVFDRTRPKRANKRIGNQEFKWAGQRGLYTKTILCHRP